MKRPQQAGVDAGSGVSELALLDDSIPLPTKARYQPGALGDQLLAPASGDPFFLGFVGGAYFPPASEAIAPELTAALLSSYTDGRPSAATYAFVMFDKRMTPARIAALEALGCRTLGFHPHYTMKVAVPITAIERVAALDGVRWIGVPQTWQRVDPRLASAMSDAPASVPLDIYINVYESDLNPASTVEHIGSSQTHDGGGVVTDLNPAQYGGERWTSNGWQQRALERAGVEVVEYVDSIRAFRARMLPAAVEGLLGLDFVQTIDLAQPPQLHHDESQPAVLSDLVRAYYDGNVNGVVCGEIDSGFWVAHEALDHVLTFGWDHTGQNNAFWDSCGHGTHVGGTILANPPAVDARLTGTAPRLGWLATRRFRVVKDFYYDWASFDCVSSSTTLSTLFQHMRTSLADGVGNVSPKPQVINNSWGASPYSTGAFLPFSGSDPLSRMLDTEVWNHGQLYVFSAGNDGSAAQTINAPGCAKNAFTVGASSTSLGAGGYPGSIAALSSRGPCADGRWKPNITAPGINIESADNGPFGYTNDSGTSMAAPHVTGAAAALIDDYTWLADAPARVASLLMATAMTNNAQLLTTPADGHLRDFGAGRLNAGAAHFPIGDNSWMNWSFTLNSGSAIYSNFTVPSGTTRMVVCTTWYEDQCSSGASQALVNDLDLYIDSPLNGIDPANNTGEYFAQQSRVDNTEIRILDNPTPGSWRWKMWPYSTSSDSHVGVTVALIHGDVTPDGSLAVTANDLWVRPNDDVAITATVYNPSYFASHVFADSSSTGDVLQSARVTLKDGIVADLIGNMHNGRDVLLGTIPANDTRSVTWTTRWLSEGYKAFYVDTASDNALGLTASVAVMVDGTEPGLVGNLTSSTHALNTWSNVGGINFTWSAASDNLSGIDGYSVAVGSAGVVPDQIADYASGVLNVLTTPGNGTFYCAVRSVDRCGNWDAEFAITGPYKIDQNAPSNPSNASCSTHTIGVQSCNTSVSMDWSAASDALSGLAGYIAVWDTSPTTTPTGALNLAATTTGWTSNIGSSTSGRYFHLRARDNAGNWGGTLHFGPIYANASSVLAYCTGKTNSLGCVPAIGSVGQPDKSAGTFKVTCTNVINNRIGYVFWGFAPATTPYQGGIKCVAAPTYRTPNQLSGGNASGNDCSGSYTYTFTTAYMNAYSLDPGDTVYVQWWMRDPSSPSTTGLSNALRFTVCE